MAKWFHTDHGLTSAAQQAAEDALYEALGGVRIGEVAVVPFVVDSDDDAIPCALYGPAMGDSPVHDFEVHHAPRGSREWDSRLIPALPRMVRFGVVVGRYSPEPSEPGGSMEVFTAYGGPLAPRELADPSMTDEAEREYARAFWRVHALATGR